MVPPGAAAWLADGGRRKVALVSLLFDHQAAFRTRRMRQHLGTMPGAVRVSCDTGLSPGTIVEPLLSGQRFPFLPACEQWPTVTYTLDPQQRSASTAPIPVRLLPNADLPDRARQTGGMAVGLGRVELWTDGLPLDQAWTLAEGVVTVGKTGMRGTASELAITDGDPLRDSPYPPDKSQVDLDLFADMPALLAGKFPRRRLYGDLPDDVPLLCVPISQDGRRFYVADGRVIVRLVQVNGTPYSGTFRLVTVPFADNSGEATVIEFAAPVLATSDTAAVTENLLSTFVTASGGRGLTPGLHPIITLLEEIGGYEIEPASRALAEQFPSNFMMLLGGDSEGTVLSIARDRLMPQTVYCLAFVRGRIRFFPLFPDAPTIRMSVGAELRGRLDTDEIETPDAQIANAIEVQYQRNPLATDDLSAATRQYLLDRYHGSADVRALCDASQTQKDRRFVRITAPDLIALTAGVPASVITLARATALLHAFPHRDRRYAAGWWPGAGVERGYRVLLNEPDEHLMDVPTRVISQTIDAPGVVLTLRTEDAFGLRLNA